MGLFSWLFGKKKKKKEEKTETEKAKKVVVTNANTVAGSPASTAGVVVDTEEGEVEGPAGVSPDVGETKKPKPETAEEKTVEKNIEKVKKKETSKSSPKPEKSPGTKKGTSSGGKYEVFPEADFHKFRLKASNGAILVVSQGYTSKRGAKSGINTFKKNVKSGNFEITTDKSGYSHFTLYTKNGARIVAVGELYDSVSDAKSAVESVKKFHDTDKVETLDELPKDEVREEKVELKPVEEKDTGTYEIYEEDGEWFFRLKASNGEVLLISQGYTSKSGCLSGLDTAKSAIEEGAFTVTRDSQDRYQFKLYGSNNQALLTGQSYGSKDRAISAMNSVRRFGLKADIEEQ